MGNGAYQEWQYTVKKSLQKIGQMDFYNLSTPLQTEDSKEINDEVVPVIIGVIRLQNSHSRRQLHISLGLPSSI